MRPVPHDDYERSVLANIREHDWHCTSVGGDETTPTFTYSVGLHEKLGHPELILIGLAPRLAHAVLSIVVRAAQHGHPFDPDEPCDELLEGYSCLFLDVPPGHYEDWVRSACWYYGGEPFPLLQVVWPSLDGHYPWHEDADDELRFAQPLLAPHASAS